MSLSSVLCALFMASCGSNGDAVAYPEVEIHIAHINDHHSQLEPFQAVELTLDGQPTQVELGGFPRLTTLFKQQVAEKRNLLKLHAGDALTGTLYYTLFKGEADAAMMNTVCFDAFELGNHEFDDGDATLATFLSQLRTPGCATPVLAANVAPAPGTPLNPDGVPVLQPYVVRTFDGVKVGIIGIDIVGKTTNSSRPLPSTRFFDEAATAQRFIDELKAQGVRHIVLMTHQGYDADRKLAAALTDVDVIIGGDSHSLLGDFASMGLSSSGAYPTVVKNKDGDPVCIGQAWEYGKVLGQMNVKFNDRGAVASCGGQASLVIGDRFQRTNASGALEPIDAETKAGLLAKLAADPRVKVTVPDPGAASILASFTTKISTERARTIGRAPEALCLVRVPGESTNRSAGVAGCETAHQQARGSDVAQVVAQAFLAASKRAHFALQNGGGTRTPVPAGAVSMNTPFSLLPFSNVLVELDVTGAQVLAVLEDAVANHIDAGLSDGSHPYAAGLRWDLDMSRPRGDRFSNVQVRDRETGRWSALDPARTYVLVTHDYAAAGKDGYATLGTVYGAGAYVNTYLLYTQTFADYVAARGTLARPARTDYSHQKVVTQAGVELP